MALSTWPCARLQGLPGPESGRGAGLLMGDGAGLIWLCLVDLGVIRAWANWPCLLNTVVSESGCQLMRESHKALNLGLNTQTRFSTHPRRLGRAPNSAAPVLQEA